MQSDAQSLFFQGSRQMEAGDFAGAESSFEQAIQIFPDFAEAYVNLGLLLEKRGKMESAEACYRRAIELNCEYSQPHLNLGVLLAKQKRFIEAEAAYRQAIALKPHSAAAWSNLGVLCACMQREAEAERCQRTAMFLDADYAMARFNLSYLLLRQGRFEEGWFCLEARTGYAGLAEYLTVPGWQGESLAGKSILVGYEAGHGDMIQFCRYVAVLKERGASAVTLLCHPPLKALFATLAGVDAVISFDEPLPASGWDLWTPLMSIPFHCKTRLDSVPAALPYLHAAKNRIEKWAPLIPENGFRVGLVWKGSPLFENDADRSLPTLSVLAPLWSVQGVTFVSLQKGAGENEAPPEGMRFERIGPQLSDFADTAAVVSLLDLVICVDTAVAHLSGAFGKPCWVLLPEYKTDWRWLTERTDTPWYPGVMRLFRQSVAGDWTPVVDEVVSALEQLVQSANAP